jgi:hypothetical protein
MKRNKNLRELSFLLTGLAAAMGIAQAISPIDGAWMIVAEFTALALFGWVLYWKLPMPQR